MFVNTERFKREIRNFIQFWTSEEDEREQMYKVLETYSNRELTGENKKEGDIKDLIIEGLQIDGGHHKQWYLEQLADELDIDTNNISHREGITP